MVKEGVIPSRKGAMGYANLGLAFCLACLLFVQSATASTEKLYHCECNCLKCDGPSVPCLVPASRISEPFTQEQIDAGECNPEACVNRNGIPSRCADDTKILSRARLLVEVPSPPAAALSPANSPADSLVVEVPSGEPAASSGQDNGASAGPAAVEGKAFHSTNLPSVIATLGAFLASAMALAL